MTYKPNYDEPGKEQFCLDIAKRFATDVVTTAQIKEFMKETNQPFPHFLINDKTRSDGWGKYRVAGSRNAGGLAKSPVAKSVSAALLLPAIPAQNAQITAGSCDAVADYFVPPVNPTYVAFGFHQDLKTIIEAKIFYPVYITGMSGNGKTEMPLQICATLGREVVRVNITKDTDELDLFGSYELINGNSIRREGPVITAMKRGAILLLDEVDYGTERLLCLQPVLEGKAILDKKTNTVVYPAPGFNIVATANTKGKGSSDGRFIGANVMNEAFLERFAITVEQEYPNNKTEYTIIEKNFHEMGLDQPHNASFIKALVNWAEMSRKSFDDGAIDEVISTRRLVHISKAFSVFRSRKKAVRLCLNRFDSDTRDSLYDFYTKIDGDQELSADYVTPVKKAAAVVPPMPREPISASSATAKGTTIASAQSDIEYVPSAASMSRTYGTPISIRNEGGHIAVYSHGKRMAKAASAIPSVTSTREFEQAIKKMIEVNASK